MIKDDERMEGEGRGERGEGRGEREDGRREAEMMGGSGDTVRR